VQGRFNPILAKGGKVLFISSPTNKKIQCARFIKATLMLAVMALMLWPANAPAQGRRAVVIDERLAALYDEPSFSARLVRRLGRGRTVAIMSMKRTPDGVTFYRVAATRRTRGWLQSEAVVSPARKGDDARLLNLVRASQDFDRIARAYIFLETFPKSPLLPAALLLYGNAAEDAARKLSSEAARRLDADEMKANSAPVFSYFMNYHGLDRYRRQGINFVFDQATKQYHYEGAAWREIVRRYPQSAEAVEARQRLDVIKVAGQNRLR
jgi:hypothetical protein